MVTENEKDDPKKPSIKKREVIFPDGKKKMLNVHDGMGFQLYIFTKINSNTTKYSHILIGAPTNIKTLSKILFNAAAKSVAKNLKGKVEKNFEHFSNKDLRFDDFDPKVSFFYEQLLNLLNDDEIKEDKVDELKEESVETEDENILELKEENIINENEKNNEGNINIIEENNNIFVEPILV
jgi:hypothetical protein